MGQGFKDVQQYNEAMARVRQVCGVRTQVQLAEFLGVRQSSISDGNRRRSIPDGWLLTMLRRTGVDPDWILTGKNERWRLLSDDFQRPVDREALESQIRAEVDNLGVSELLERLRALLPGVRVIIADADKKVVGTASGAGK
jgi:predicted transcriptional regulator